MASKFYEHKDGRAYSVTIESGKIWQINKRGGDTTHEPILKKVLPQGVVEMIHEPWMNLIDDYY